MEVKVKIQLSLNSEIILKNTNWDDEKPEIPPLGIPDGTVDDMIATGLIFKCEDGFYKLTDVGEEVLNHISKANRLVI